MEKFDLGEIIAEREFEVEDQSGVTKKIILHFGKPFPDPHEGGDWCCPYQILGFDNDIVEVSYGVDSMQALILSIKKASTQLNYYQKINKMHITWLGMDDLELL